MRNYCTLCDIKYLPRALALYRSLQKWDSEICFYVLGCDRDTVEVIDTWHAWDKYANMIVTPLASLEKLDPFLKQARSNRSRTEYLWTLASYYTWTLLQIEKNQRDGISYLDADTYFFHDPRFLYVFDEKQTDVAIVPHRWTPKYRERLCVNGTYNVSWVYFSGSETSMQCAHEWAGKCMSWCYNIAVHPRHEMMGEEWVMFADQGYLEMWPNKYDAHVAQNPGIGLAPWNQERYEYRKYNSTSCENHKRLYIKNSCGTETPIVFYHFHEFEEREGKMVKRTYYPLHPFVAEYIYKPYEAMIEECYGEVRTVFY